MNNSGVNAIPGGPANPFVGAENMANPNAPMTPEAMQKMQEQMMQQMQKMQEMQNKLMQMQGNNVFQQNGISVQNRSENANTNLKHEQDVAPQESVAGKLNQGTEAQDTNAMRAVTFGEKNDGAAAEKMITDEEIDAPVENSPLEKDMAALEKTKAEAEKKEAEAEGDPDFKAIDEAAEAANIQRDTENYKFVKNVVKSLDPKNPAQMSKNLNHARWAYMERIFNRKLGDGLSGKAA
jgi:hypothetical protein